MIRVWASGLLVCLVLAAPSVSEAGGHRSLEELTGQWKLDWDQSESFKPALKALEVPWLIRQMAGVVSIQVTIAIAPLECEACQPSLQISSENPIKNTSRVVRLDGVPQSFTDPLGNESMDLFTWNAEDGLEMVRERALDSGKAARILEQKRVTDDRTKMISTMTVWVEGEERASVRRVLVKVEP